MDNQKLLLLGLLRHQKMHGYQLFEFIERNLATCTDIKKPTAYFLLHQMENDGWVRIEHAQEGNRPPRKIFVLTEAGERAFWQLLTKNLSHYFTVAFPTDIGLAFLDQLKPSEAIQLLQIRKQSLFEALERIKVIPIHSGSTQLLIDHQKAFLEFELNWLEALLDSLILTK
ncbi:MAG: PadR family transcriptional regulator [Anaerolineales bacterium]